MIFLNRLSLLIREWSTDIAGILFPNICEVCGRALAHGEEVVCLDCLISLPRTYLHRSDFNHIHRCLAHNARVERAAGFFYYVRGDRYAKLIQVAKYNNRPQVARYLAAIFARELIADNFFSGIDLIVPVPLHKSKERKRGYNQSREIAKALSAVTSIAIAEPLTATAHSSQTRLDAYGRWLNSRNTFSVDNAVSLRSRHILLVDDVLTTGATLSACCEAIHASEPSAKISVLTLGVAHMQ